MNYVALGIIAEVDNLVADCTQDTAIEVVKGNDDWHPKIIHPKVQFKDRKKWNKCVYCVYYGLKYIHVVGIFYYFAFLSIALNYLFVATSCEDLEDGECDRVSYSFS
eukprot:CAMPEP_0116877264 /NCGR_PEP_ID=MMETSP0463-20121206/9059_1 /TAXON_ID=181622 /ORGANISM="Strombidinopsis sp, Strain SopsisLIS2011" /LENGTH=106 /DNA_ID=CAMNT_0004524401 /DNA_START=2871 /DNA_END=3191 /DNA_ORIENTATION=+